MRIESKVLNREKFNLLNLKSNIEFILKDYKFRLDPENCVKIISERIKNIVDETIRYHIDNGDISYKFGEDFKVFFMKMINIEIN